MTSHLPLCSAMSMSARPSSTTNGNDNDVDRVAPSPSPPPRSASSAHMDGQSGLTPFFNLPGPCLASVALSVSLPPPLPMSLRADASASISMPLSVNHRFIARLNASIPGFVISQVLSAQSHPHTMLWHQFKPHPEGILVCEVVVGAPSGRGPGERKQDQQYREEPHGVRAISSIFGRSL